jgi:HAD superfamily hydrolase (TIGR01549 family)
VTARLRDAVAGFDGYFFDAGFTLLEPVRPVAEVYAEKARALGVAADDGRMAEAVARVWKRDVRAQVATDLRSSEESERETWERFTAEVATEFPGLPARHGAWLAALVDWFDRPASWRTTPGATEVLDAIAATGKPAAVVSNWHGALHAIAAATGVGRRVRFVLTSAEAGRRKPHPEIFRLAAERLGVSPARVLHVGDSVGDDLEGARAAGLGGCWLVSAADSVKGEPLVGPLLHLLEG